MRYCKNCGSKIYDGYCINCCEETYIAYQNYDTDEPIAMSKEFWDKVNGQAEEAKEIRKEE